MRQPDALWPHQGLHPTGASHHPHQPRSAGILDDPREISRLVTNDVSNAMRTVEIALLKLRPMRRHPDSDLRRAARSGCTVPCPDTCVADRSASRTCCVADCTPCSAAVRTAVRTCCVADCTPCSAAVRTAVRTCCVADCTPCSVLSCTADCGDVIDRVSISLRATASASSAFFIRERPFTPSCCARLRSSLMVFECASGSTKVWPPVMGAYGSWHPKWEKSDLQRQLLIK